MGLTIHYTLQSEAWSSQHVHDLIARLRSRAMDLPFEHVSPVVELKDDRVSANQHEPRSPARWLLCQSRAWVEVGNTSYPVEPTHVIAFSTSPGAGCEPANFGLCLFPKTFLIREASPGQKTKRIPTRLSGWRWGSFCKTQYASNRDCGGVKNFLRCHVSVITLLDQAKELSILSDVNDEGEYWEKRDLAELAREVGQWNAMLAGFFGRLKDLTGGQLLAEITKFPDFEHLAAQGRTVG